MKPIQKFASIICLIIGMVDAIVFILTKDTYWGIFAIILYLTSIINDKD